MNASIGRRIVVDALLTLRARAVSAAPVIAEGLPSSLREPADDRQERCARTSRRTSAFRSRTRGGRQVDPGGQIFEDLHQEMRYPDAIDARKALYALDRKLGSAETANWSRHHMSHGPVARARQPAPAVPAHRSDFPQAAACTRPTRQRRRSTRYGGAPSRASRLGSRTVARRADAACQA
jgi:hypothetical protein